MTTFSTTAAAFQARRVTSTPHSRTTQEEPNPTSAATNTAANRTRPTVAIPRDQATRQDAR